MNGRTFFLRALCAALLTGSSAASAQYYPYPPPLPPGGIAGEIARGAGTAAQAVGAIADAVRGTLYGYGYRGQGERLAVDACGYRAQQHGRVTISEVYPKDRRDWRVNGFVDRQAGKSGWGYGTGVERRTFACTVRYDGRVTRFKTKKLRY